MTVDFRISTQCNHLVFQTLTLQGSSPDYWADLDYKCNANLSTIHIFDANVATPEELFGMQGVGISNIYVDPSNKKIVFGAYPVDAGMNFPNPDSRHVPSDLYFCSYIAQKSECPKCNSTDRVSDIEIDATGRIATVTGTDKIRQQILKALMTIQGSNLYDVGYGSIADSMVGQKMDAYSAASLQFSILNCLNNLSQTQKDNNLPSNETIASISDISAVADVDNPLKVNIVVTIMTQDYQQVSTSMSMRL